MYDFPNSPATNQVFGNYTWDGEKWTQTTTAIVPSSTNPLMDGMATAGSSLLYTRGDHVHPNDTTRLQVDAAQGLPATQQAQGRSNIYATPFDALAFNGIQINGSMEVSQENGSTLIANITGGAVDGWSVAKIGTMVLAAQQVTDAPPGYANSVKITVTTAEASLGSGDVAYIGHAIEGYRISRLAFGSASPQPISIGFWTKIHRPGTYSGSIKNYAGNRSYPFSFVQNAADTWEFKTVTIPGDTTGTWVNTNAGAMALSFCLGSGATFLGAANVWAAANFLGATGTINGVAATTDVFQITGVVVLPGIELPASAGAPFIMRPFGQEIALCQRYYQKSYAYGTKPGTAVSAGSGTEFLYNSSGTYGASWRFINSMRALPTLTPYDNSGASGKITYYSGTWNNGGTPGITVVSEMGFGMNTAIGGATYASFDWVADARI